MDTVINNLKFSIRFFLKDKFFSALNVLGLALGIGVSIILLLILRDDLTYDHYFAKNNRIYRFGCHYKITGDDSKFAAAARELVPVLKEEYPEIERIVPIHKLGRALVKVEEGPDEVAIMENHFAQVDSNYFYAFDHEFISGSPRTAMKGEKSMVLTESLAKKYFEDVPIGKSLIINNETYTVTGVIKDFPANVHLRLDALLSGLTPYRDWTFKEGQIVSEAFWNPDLYLYLLMPENYQPHEFYDRWPLVYNKYFKETGDKVEGSYTPILERLPDIHLYSELFDDEVRGSISYLIGFTSIGFFIFLLASINYMNLSTAKAANRAIEIAVKKVVGSSRTSLTLSFLTESVLLSFISLVLAIGFVFFILKATSFNELVGRRLEPDFLQNPLLLAGSVGITLLIGLLSGLYPALYLPRISTVKSLKGTLKSDKSGYAVRRVLIATQFFVSIFVIICTLFMRDQMEFLRTADLGFDKENVMVFPVEDSLEQHVPAIVRELRQQSGVLAVTTSFQVMSVNGYTQVMLGEREGEWTRQGGIIVMTVGDDYLRTMGITLLQGLDLAPGPRNDSAVTYLVSQSAAKVMGWPDPIGKKVKFWHGEQPGPVIGVIKDFNFNALYQKADPVIIRKAREEGGYVYVKVAAGHSEDVVGEAKTVMAKFSPRWPFEYFFLDQKIEGQYKADEVQRRLLFTLTNICIFISLLGLTGLSAFTAIQRTKEIGVRKVLGAKSADIIVLLSRDVFKIALVSALLVVPSSWWMMSRWLDNFAYKIEITYLPYILVTGTTLGFVILIVLIQSMRTVLASPVESLKYE